MVQLAEQKLSPNMMTSVKESNRKFTPAGDQNRPDSPGSSGSLTPPFAKSTPRFGGLSSRSPSAQNLQRSSANSKSIEEEARHSIAQFAQQQAPLLADMFVQRFIHVTNVTGVDIDAVHSSFIAEFVPSFLDYLHASMAQSAVPVADQCSMCHDLGQLAQRAVANSSSPTSNHHQQLQQQRSNSVSLSSKSKLMSASSTLMDQEGTCGSVGAAPSSAVSHKLKHFFGNLVHSRSRHNVSNGNSDAHFVSSFFFIFFYFQFHQCLVIFYL